MKPGHTGVYRLIKATQFSKQGLVSAWQSEAAFRQELLLCLPLMATLCFWQITLSYKLILLGTLVLMLVTELLNSAIESVVDLVCEEQHPLAGQAKDMGSAAVSLSLLLVATAWGLIFMEDFGWL